MPPSPEAVVIRKIGRRIVWFLVLLMFCAVMDRVNIGFAALGMNHDLGLTAATFGLGAGLFSLGYLLCEVPSNLMLYKFGARRWICRIMITWGVLSMATCLARTPMEFYALRFLLGAAEAGFLPGVMLYLGNWFPDAYRARYNSLFLLAMPLGQTVGAVLSGLLLQMNGTLGLAGWRWLFLLEGLPTVVLGIVTLFYLPDRPQQARWLAAEERTLVARLLAEEAHAHRRMDTPNLLATLLNRSVLGLGLVYFLVAMVLTGVPLWMPQIMRGLGLPFGVTGLLTALPPLAGAAAMLAWGHHSDRHLERTWHIVAAVGLTALGWVLAVPSLHSAWALVPALMLANAGILCATSVFWSLPSALLTGASAAAGIALIDAIGNVGAAIGPLLVGHLRDASGGFGAGFVFMAVAALAAGLVLLAVRPGARSRPAAIVQNG